MDKENLEKIKLMIQWLKDNGPKMKKTFRLNDWTIVENSQKYVERLIKGLEYSIEKNWYGSDFKATYFSAYELKKFIEK